MLGLLGNGVFTKALLGILSLVVLIFAGLWLYTRIEAANLRTELTEAKSEVTRLLSEVETFETLAKANETANNMLRERLVEERAEAKALFNTLKEIDDAPETDDAPVAPILKRFIDGLPAN